MRVLFRLLACIGAIWALLVVTTPARSEPREAEAAELERQAREDFSAGQFAEAGEKFDAADRLAPHPELRFNSAVAWEKAKEPARAADAYERALRRGGLDDKHVRRAQASLAGLKETLGYVKVMKPTGGSVSVAHVARAPVPVQFHLVPGEYQLELEAPDGTRATRPLSVRAGEVVAFEGEVGSSATVTAAPRKTKSEAPSPRPRETPATGGSSRSTWGWVSLGLGAAFAGAAVFFGTQTLDAADDYEASGYRDASARERGVRNRALTNVALAASVVGLGAGTYLLLSSDPSSKNTGSRVMVRVRF